MVRRNKKLAHAFIPVVDLLGKVGAIPRVVAAAIILLWVTFGGPIMENTETSSTGSSNASSKGGQK